MAEAVGIDLGTTRIVDAPHSHASAARAVEPTRLARIEPRQFHAAAALSGVVVFCAKADDFSQTLRAAVRRFATFVSTAHRRPLSRKGDIKSGTV